MKIVHIDFGANGQPEIYDVLHLEFDSTDLDDGSSFGYCTFITTKGTICATTAYVPSLSPAKYVEGVDLTGVSLVCLCQENF
jgi:hypothetical protein